MEMESFKDSNPCHDTIDQSEPNLCAQKYCETFAKDDVCWFYRTEDLTFWLKVISMALVVLLGVVGNVLLAVTIIKCPRLRTKSINIFIANLSISNIINLSVVAPLVTLDNLSEFFVLGSIGCKLKLVLEYLFFIVPMLSILVISIDRFLAIRFPFRDLKYSKLALTLCAVIWLIALTVSGVKYYTQVFQTYYFKDITVNICLSTWENLDQAWQNQRIYMFTLVSLVFIFPLAGLTVFYSCMILNMKSFYAKMGIRDAVHQQNISNIAKMVITVLTATIVCWLPLVIDWIRKYAPHTNSPDGSQFGRTENKSTFNFVCHALVFLYSALQPPIYFLTGTKLRTGLKRMLRRSNNSAPAPPPVSVISPAQDISDDEGFSSTKEEDNTSEYDTDLHDDQETPGRQGKTDAPPGRKLSFYMDFDPVTTPPPSPRPEKKISILSWSFNNNNS